MGKCKKTVRRPSPALEWRKQFGKGTRAMACFAGIVKEPPTYVMELKGRKSFSENFTILSRTKIRQ